MLVIAVDVDIWFSQGKQVNEWKITFADVSVPNSWDNCSTFLVWRLSRIRALVKFVFDRISWNLVCKMQNHSSTLVDVSSKLVTATEDMKLGWCWQTHATRLEVSQGHQTYYHPYVRYSFLLCNSNCVFSTRRFRDIRLPKYLDLEIRVRGHSRSLKVVPFYMVFY